MPGRGLEDVIAVESAISSITGDTLTYRGIPVEELAEHATFEEVIYLLWYGRLPNRQEYAAFTGSLLEAMHMPEQVNKNRKLLPAAADHLGILRTLLSIAALYDSGADERSADTALRIMGMMPVLVAASVIQQPLPQPDPDLGLAANLLYMIEGEAPDELRARTLDQALILHADHELNASTFTARVAGSALANLYSATIAAICTLSGALHGGASSEVYALLDELETPDQADTVVGRRLAHRQRIPGFGHRVYTGEDPRGRLLRRMLEHLVAHGATGRWLDRALAVEASVTRRTPFHTNLDFYAAPLFVTLGLAPVYLPLLFALGRSAGWLAHILEQYANNRLLRPRAAYTGLHHMHFVPMDERR